MTARSQPDRTVHPRRRQPFGRERTEQERGEHAAECAEDGDPHRLGKAAGDLRHDRCIGRDHAAEKLGDPRASLAEAVPGDVGRHDRPDHRGGDDKPGKRGQPRRGPPPRRVCASHWTGSSSSADGIVAVDRAQLRRGEAVGRAVKDDTAVPHRDDPVGDQAGKVRLVRREDQRRAAPARGVGEQAQDALRAHRVEVADRLVGQDQLRLLRQAACNRDALALAAAELVHAAVAELRDAGVVQRGVAPRPRRRR